MKTKLTVAAALAGTLVAACFVAGSAQATSLPVLKGDATASIVTLVGKKGGGGHGGFKGHGGYKGGGKHFSYKGGGYKGGKHYAYKGGGYKGGKHYAYKGGGYKGGKHYAYKGGGKHYGYKRYSHYGKYRYGWYGAPFIAYGYYGGGCGWLYRNAVATGDPYWWNRYYECVGYY